MYLKVVAFGGRDMKGALMLVAVLAGFVFIVSPSAAAAQDDPWVARHGLTGEQYQAEFDRLGSQGYRLASVSGYEQNGAARYAAIWSKSDGPAWQARHGLTAAQYQATVNALSAQGYRPVLVNGYSIGGSARYAAIFWLDRSVPWVARHGLTPAQYQAEFDTWVARGYRLAHVSGYTDGGEERYAAIWVQRAGPAWQAVHGQTAGQYQATFDRLTAEGYHPVEVSGYEVAGTTKYAALFEAGSALPWVARHGLDATDYQATFTDLRYQAYRPLSVSGYATAGGPRFAAVWENRNYTGADLEHIDSTVTSAMRAAGTVGLSLAISRHGRLVFAKGYGLADNVTKAPMHVSSRLRIASVSKPFTAMEVLRLVEAGRLKLSDKVFGPGSLLGEAYGPASGYADSRVNDITLEELLRHTAGGWDNDGNDGTPDPMFLHTELSQADLIRWVLKNVPLEFAPGTRYQYSNFGYMVLGRIIERMTGKSYETAMRDDIFSPSGATSFALARDTLTQRLPDEVAYHHAGAQTAPYQVPITRMDAHGGWIATPVDLVRVGLRVDGFATVPDLLAPATVAAMTTPTTAPRPNGDPSGDSMGWSVNDIPNWWHDGYLDGTTSILVRTAPRYGASGTDEFVWAAVTNSTNANRDSNLNIDDLMYRIVNGIHSWPAIDLLP